MNFGHLRCLETQNQIKYKFDTVLYQLAFISTPGRVSDVSETTYERLCTLKHMQVHVGYSHVPRPFNFAIPCKTSESTLSMATSCENNVLLLRAFEEGEKCLGI